jgi:hypothetical protein
LNIPEGQAKCCIVFIALVFPALAISIRVKHEKAALWQGEFATRPPHANPFTASQQIGGPRRSAGHPSCQTQTFAIFSSVAMVIPPPLIADAPTSALAAEGMVAHVEHARFC